MGNRGSSNSISTPSLPQSSFTLTEGSQYAWLDASRTIEDYFDFDSSWSMDDVECELRRWGSDCDGTFPHGAVFHFGETGIFAIDTTTAFDISDVCIGCKHGSNEGYTDEFSLKTESGTCSASSINLQDIAGTGLPSLAAGIYKTSIDDVAELKFSKKEDGSSNNCAVDHYVVMNSATAASYSEVQTSSEGSSGIKIAPSATTAEGDNFQFRIRVEFTADFYVIIDDGVFSWTFSKSCSGVTLTQGGFPLSRTDTQWVHTGSAAFFALPEFTSPDTADCPIKSYQLSTSDSGYSDHTQLDDVTSNSDASLVAVPSNLNTETTYEFYLRAFVTDSKDQYSSQFKLIVGCPTSEITITYAFTAPAADAQFVPYNSNSNTKFTLPDFTTPAVCPITALQAKQADNSATDHPDLQTPSGGFVVPSSISQEAKHEFWIRAEASGKHIYTSKFELVVGCPSSVVTLSQGSFPTGFSDTQFVELGNSDPQRFIIPTFSSDKTTEGCDVADYRVSDSTGSFTAKPALNDPALNGATREVVVATMQTAPITYTFYVQAGTAFRTNSATVFSNELTLVIGCDTTRSDYGFTLPTLDAVVSVPPSDAAATVYLFGKVVSTLQSCPVVEYVVSEVSGSNTQHPQLTAPSEHDANTMKFAPTDIASTTYYEFYIGYKGQGMTSFLYMPTKYTLVVDCPLTYSMTPVISSTYKGSLTHTQYVDKGDAAVTRFYLPGIEKELANCPLDFPSFDYSTSSGSHTALSTLVGLTSEVDGSDTYYYTAPTSLAQDAHITFYIRVHFANSQTFIGSQLYTFIVGCPTELTALTISEGAFTGSYGYSQNVHRDNKGTHQTFFMMNALTSSISYCPPHSFQISSSSGSFSSMPSLAIDETTPGVVKVVPTDLQTSARYQFYIQAQSAGTVTIMPTQRVLDVGCLPSWVGISEVISVYRQKIIINSGDYIADASYTKPSLVTGVGTCAITKLTLVDATASVQLSTATSCTSDPDCTDVTTPLNNARANFTFHFDVEMGHGAFTYSSPQLTLEVDCDVASSTVSFAPLERIILNYNDPSPYVMTHLECSVPSCCYSMAYEAFSDPSMGSSTAEVLSIGSAASDPKHIEFTFDTSALTNSSFAVKATNPFGTWQVSPAIQIEVKFNCTRDDHLNFSISEPTATELAAIKNYGVYRKQADHSFRLMPFFKVGDLESLDLDITNRFMNSALPGSCPLQDYRIDKVIDGEASTVYYSAWRNDIAVNSSGFFQVTDTKSPIEKYIVYVSVFNGAIWSDSEATGPLLELTINKEFIDLPNIPPTFLDELADLTVPIALDNSTWEPVEYTLPKVYDANQDETSVHLMTKLPYLQYDSELNKLIVDPAKIEKSANITVSFKVQDSKGASSTRFMKISINKEEPEPLEEEDDKESTTPGNTDGGSIDKNEPGQTNFVSGEDKNSGTELEQRKVVTGAISSIDKFGLIRITFNSTMSSLPLATFNDTTLKLSIQQNAIVDEPLPPVDFTWKTMVFTGRYLELQLVLPDPLSVSTGIEQDTLFVEFSTELQELLYSPSQQQYLHSSSLRLKKKIPKQMPDNLATRTLESGAETSEVSLKYMLGITFTLNFVLAGGMRYMLLLVRSLQIVLHIPLIRVVIPSNVSQLFKSLIPIATFDLFDPDWTTKLIFEFDDEKQTELQDDLLDQMVDLGYETHNSILNLGSLAIFTFIYFVQLAVLGICAFLNRFTRLHFRFVKSWAKSLIFGDLIAILIDAYFEFLISGYLQIRQPLNTTRGETWSSVLGIFTYILILGFMNYAFARLLLTPLKTVQDDPVFEQRWGQLHEGVKKTSKATLAYFPIFAARRVAFLLMAFYIHAYYQFQLIGLIIMNTVMFIYIGLYKPLESRLMNRIELANETMVAVATIHLLFFTQWVDGEVTKFNCGWSMLGVICILMGFNLVFVLQFGIRSVRLVSVRYFRRVKLWLSKKEGIRQHIPLDSPKESSSNLSHLISPGVFHDAKAQYETDEEGEDEVNEDRELVTSQTGKRQLKIGWRSSQSFTEQKIASPSKFVTPKQERLQQVIKEAMKNYDYRGSMMGGLPEGENIMTENNQSFGVQHPSQLMNVQVHNRETYENPQDILDVIMGQEVLKCTNSKVVEGQPFEFDDLGNKLETPPQDPQIELKNKKGLLPSKQRPAFVKKRPKSPSRKKSPGKKSPRKKSPRKASPSKEQPEKQETNLEKEDNPSPDLKLKDKKSKGLKRPKSPLILKKLPRKSKSMKPKKLKRKDQPSSPAPVKSTLLLEANEKKTKNGKARADSPRRVHSPRKKRLHRSPRENSVDLPQREMLPILALERFYLEGSPTGANLVGHRQKSPLAPARAANPDGLRVANRDAPGVDNPRHDLRRAKMKKFSKK